MSSVHNPIVGCTRRDMGSSRLKLRSTIDPTTMLAFWLVGFEASAPDDSGEICIIELFGDSIGTTTSELSIGVKAHHDPRLQDDMARVSLDIDASAWHTYSAEWAPDQVRFFVDYWLVRTVDQDIDYPMQLMVDLCEFRADEMLDMSHYPKFGEVRAVRGFRRPER